MIFPPQMSDLLACGLEQVPIKDMRHVWAAGMFARAMNSSADGTVRAAADLTADVGALAGVLAAELEALGSPAAGGATLAGHELWLGPEEAEALVAAVRPKLANVRKGLEELLFEVVALQARGPLHLVPWWHGCGQHESTQGLQHLRRDRWTALIEGCSPSRRRAGTGLGEPHATA